MQKPLLATGNKGFTLIELLIVIAIVAIVTSIAVMRVSGFGRRSAAVIAAQLRQTMLAAQHQAILMPQTLKFVLTSHGYQFYADKSGEWYPLSKDSLSAKAIFPAMIDVSLEPEAIIFSQSGEITPFVLLVRHKKARKFYRLMPGDQGELILKEVAT